MSRLFYLVFLILVINSCEKDAADSLAEGNLVVGSWIDRIAEGDIWIQQRSEKLVDGQYGFTFKANGLFIERKNAGWCGTPPVTYGDFKGTWSQQDSLIYITVAYWGGMVDYTWRIISLSEKELRIREELFEYHPD